MCVVTGGVSDVCPTLVSLSPAHHRCFHPINPKRGENKIKRNVARNFHQYFQETQYQDEFEILSFPLRNVRSTETFCVS